MRSLRLALAALAVALAAPALAQTATANLAVSATVVNSCRIAANALAFGNYDATAASTGSGSLDVTCTVNHAYTVGLGAGANGAVAGVAGRSMILAGNHLGYDLYSDIGLTTLWTNAATVAGTGNGATQNIPVYGRIPASQFVPGGLYQDTVVATVNF
jgi:spore coat protein U-like protein